jgi:cyclase
MKSANLCELAPNVFGYFQPDGSWGLSNAGLILGQSGTALVDTLFDYLHTRRMLDAMSKVRKQNRPIDIVVNTHADGDHCYGNALLRGSRIISSAATKREMLAMQPNKLATLMTLAKVINSMGSLQRPLRSLLTGLHLNGAVNLVDAAPYTLRGFADFDFRNIELELPNETFEETLTLNLGNRVVELTKLGPTHTQGDVIAYVPDARVLFAGDILFSGLHPLVWAGTIANCIAACEKIAALDVEVIVPGHGPVMNQTGVTEHIEYFRSLLNEVRSFIAQGIPEHEATRRLVGQGFGSRSLVERLAVNVNAAYRELHAKARSHDVIAQFAEMARLSTAIEPA